MNITEADKKVADSLNDLAKALEAAIASVAGKRMGFALLVFNPGTETCINYVSNCDRDGAAGVMGSLLGSWVEESERKEPSELN